MFNFEGGGGEVYFIKVFKGERDFIVYMVIIMFL